MPSFTSGALILLLSSCLETATQSDSQQILMPSPKMSLRACTFIQMQNLSYEDSKSTPTELKIKFQSHPSRQRQASDPIHSQEQFLAPLCQAP